MVHGTNSINQPYWREQERYIYTEHAVISRFRRRWHVRSLLRNASLLWKYCRHVVAVNVPLNHALRLTAADASDLGVPGFEADTGILLSVLLIFDTYYPFLPAYNYSAAV